VFPVPGKHLKHRFLDLNKVALWGVSEVIKVAPTAKGTLETSLICFIQVAILAGQEAENYFKYQTTSRNVVL